MRKNRVVLAGALAALALVLGTGPSWAGFSGTMTVTPNPAEAPATVVVTNADAASTCDEPVQPEAEAVVPVEVNLDLSDGDGPVQSDTVTPDGSGNWSQTYTGLPVGEYTVAASCDFKVLAAPAATANFAYVPIDFTVTPQTGGPDVVDPNVDDDTEDGPISASPQFTG